jgi:hypothetical protein
MDASNATRDAVNLNDPSTFPRECFRRDFREYARDWLLDCFGDDEQAAETIRLANAIELVRYVECHHEGGVVGFIACAYPQADSGPVARATELGAEHGANAVSWLFDGNTDASAYVRLLVGIEDGDPEVLDQLPTADLSGEWADGLTPASLARECGVPDCDWSLTANAPAFGLVEDLCNAYEAAFNEAAQHEAERIARAYVEDDSTVGRLTRAAREHSGLTYRELAEAGEHGADCGWSGFTYTADTARFYDKHADDIWSLLSDQADDLGMSPLALLASFNRADDVSDAGSFRNLLAWYALEEVGRYLSDAA